MFSYPVRDENGSYVFDGYVNNITHGYTDGINPIAALKYGKATVTRVGPSPVDVGTHAPRNVIAQLSADPLDWEMRELIVQKGLPRAKLRRTFDFPSQFESHGDKPRFWDYPDSDHRTFLQAVEDTFGEALDSLLERVLVSRQNAKMPMGMLLPKDFAESEFPAVALRDLEKSVVLAKCLIEVPPPGYADEVFADLKRILNRLVDSPHRVVASFFLRPDSFLGLLRANQAVRDRFELRLNQNNRRRMIWEDDADNRIVFDEWRTSELLVAHRWLAQFQRGPSMNEEEKMLQLLKDKQSRAQNSFTHRNIEVKSNLAELFKQELYDTILWFLKTGEYNNQQLVKPGDAAGSEFFKLISDGGPMKSAFRRGRRTGCRQRLDQQPPNGWRFVAFCAVPTTIHKASNNNGNPSHSGLITEIDFHELQWKGVFHGNAILDSPRDRRRAKWVTAPTTISHPKSPEKFRTRATPTKTATPSSGKPSGFGSTSTTWLLERLHHCARSPLPRPRSSGLCTL